MKKRAKVTQETLDLIKNLVSNGVSQSKVSRLLGVSTGTMYFVVKGEYDLDKYRQVMREHKSKYDTKPKVEVQPEREEIPQVDQTEVKFDEIKKMLEMIGGVLAEMLRVQEALLQKKIEQIERSSQRQKRFF